MVSWLICAIKRICKHTCTSSKCTLLQYFELFKQNEHQFIYLSLLSLPIINQPIEVFCYFHFLHRGRYCTVNKSSCPIWSIYQPLSSFKTNRIKATVSSWHTKSPHTADFVCIMRTWIGYLVYTEDIYKLRITYI